MYCNFFFPVGQQQLPESPIDMLPTGQTKQHVDWWFACKKEKINKIKTHSHFSFVPPSCDSFALEGFVSQKIAPR